MIHNEYIFVSNEQLKLFLKDSFEELSKEFPEQDFNAPWNSSWVRVRARELFLESLVKTEFRKQKKT
jgi:hypothetical protein